MSIATFPVAHYVNHRTMRRSNSKRTSIFAFLGDELSTPTLALALALTLAMAMVIALPLPPTLTLALTLSR